MWAMIALSEKLNAPMVILGLAAVVVADVPAVVFEPPPDEHAPATIASTSIAAPTARLRLNRIWVSSFLSASRATQRRPSRHRRRRHSVPNRGAGGPSTP